MDLSVIDPTCNMDLLLLGFTSAKDFPYAIQVSWNGGTPNWMVYNGQSY
jgi:hypothetical protein